MNLSLLKTTVSKKVISFSDISAVNIIVGWNVLACWMKRSTSFQLSFLSQSQRAGKKRDNSKSTVTEVKIGERVWRASSDIAEAFNSYFSRIGEDLANKIPNSDVDPPTYVN